VRFGIALVRRFGDDDLTGMAAEMAYSFLFALFPLLLLSAAMIGMVGSVLGRTDLLLEAMAAVAPFLPPPVAKLFEAGILELVSERAGAIAALGLLLALWGAASGVGALMKGLDRAYGVARSRSPWRQRAIGAVATLFLTPLCLALLVLSAIAQGLTTWLGALTGTGEQIGPLVAALQLPVTFLVLFLVMTLIYWTLPAVPQRYREVLPGSLAAAVGWSVVTQAFGLYVSDIDEYGATYGIFGAAIAFLLWLYVVGLVTLIGAEVNALLRSSPATVLLLDVAGRGGTQRTDAPEQGPGRDSA
jgi:membrane protein